MSLRRLRDKRFYVLAETPRRIVSEHGDRVGAEKAWRRARDQHGSAALYEAPNRRLMEAHLAKAVQLVCSGISQQRFEEWQRELQQTSAGTPSGAESGEERG